MIRENITNPGKDPVAGDWIKDTYDSGMQMEHQFHNPIVPTAEETAEEERKWRDLELAATDIIAQTPDWPDRDKYLAYRVKLRDWPSTSDFPATRPELG